jgi:uncharacterized protein Yka (UPF0111/DUF47 family)
MEKIIKSINKKIAAIEKEADLVQRELWRSDYKNTDASIKQGELSKKRTELLDMLDAANELQSKLVKQGIIKA